MKTNEVGKELVLEIIINQTIVQMDLIKKYSYSEKVDWEQIRNDLTNVAENIMTTLKEWNL